MDNPAIENTPQKRLISLDLLRGTIMVLMALDHAAFFIAKRHPAEFWGLSLPEHSSWLSFLTRFVTHLCAPGFFFLMGVGMILLADSRQKRGWSLPRVVRYLALRGLVIVAVGQTLEVIPWVVGDIFPRPEAFVFGQMIPGAGSEVMLGLSVLFALGATMLLCSVLVALHPLLLVTLGAGTLLVTTVIFTVADPATAAFPMWMFILFVPGQSDFLLSMYPVIPWMGIALMGMAAGHFVVRRVDGLQTSAALIGGMLVGLFVVLRVMGDFGVFHPPDPGLMGFLSLTKYPPSLAFVALTLGCNLLLLAFLHGVQKNRFVTPILLIGRTALFFYIVHLYVFLVIGLPFRGGTGYGILYLGWLSGLALVYPLCRGYQGFRQSRGRDSLWRMF